MDPVQFKNLLSFLDCQGGEWKISCCALPIWKQGSSESHWWSAGRWLHSCEQFKIQSLGLPDHRREDRMCLLVLIKKLKSCGEDWAQGLRQETGDMKAPCKCVCVRAWCFFSIQNLLKILWVSVMPDDTLLCSELEDGEMEAHLWAWTAIAHSKTNMPHVSRRTKENDGKMDVVGLTESSPSYVPLSSKAPLFSNSINRSTVTKL